MKLFEQYREAYVSARDEEMSLLDYLELCRQEPLAYASAAERMLAAIGEPESIDTRNDPRLSRIFANRVIRRYPAFKDFYGMDDAIAQIVAYFKHAAQGLEERKQVLYLLGPVGGAAPHLEWTMDRGAAAACAEGLGCVTELFERTVAYLKQRVQFGVPIGSFQALQHRAVDMFAEAELCKSAMILAAIQVDADDAEERMAEVSAAKWQLTRGGWYVQENAIQLFGGIGVTDEQDEGLYFKRLRVLQGLFGDADHHTARFQSLARFDAALRAEA